MGVGRGVERRREREREVHKHMQEQARDQSHVIGQQRFQMTGGGFCFSFFFFDPITGDVHRGGNDCSPVGGVIGSMSADTEDSFDRNNKNRERERERSHN